MTSTHRYEGSGDAELKEQFARDGVRYGVTVGRRAPMHHVHVDCIQEIADAGLTPVIVVGSTNGADHFLFDPIRNPLTKEQQVEQMRAALPAELSSKAKFLFLDDVGDNAKWTDNLVALLEREGIDPAQTVMHYRSKSTDVASPNFAVKPLSTTEAYLANYGVGSWRSQNRNPAFDVVNASDLRKLDLTRLSPEEHDIFAGLEYIIYHAQAARDANPDKALLEGIPLTTLDLSLDRLRKETDITTAAVVERANKQGRLTIESLTQAAGEALADYKGKVKVVRPASVPFEVKIASASCNQTGGDWPRNLTNICAAIDKAVADGADILSLEELGLSGYDRGDDFYYSDNTRTREMLEVIAGYAASKDPNLVISVGHPWYFADKAIPDQDERRKNPLYNRLNNNFNVQTLITGGEIISMSAKRYLFNYERGYEKRHFEEWSEAHANEYSNEQGAGREGTIFIELPEVVHGNGAVVPGKVIPFGAPVIQVGSGERKMNLHHVICEEYWVGSRFDGAWDNGDYARDNPLAQKAEQYDITVAINPNASPPAANKIEKHYELAGLASEHAGVLVHTDGLGSSGSTFALFGSRLMAQDGKIISEGARAGFSDVGYTSQIVTLQPPMDRGHAPHAVVGHEFKNSHKAPVQDGPAAWEKGPNREFEEEMRNELLWMFDYMRKNKQQGITQALSGGADSAYNALKVRLMVALAVNELGVEGFCEAMSHLTYKDKILAAYRAETDPAKAKDAAIRVTMDNMLTCVYMGTDNSSFNTLRAAQELVEGGVMDDGTPYAGIGGKFHNRNVQRLVELYAEIYSGVNPGAMDDVREAEVRKELADILKTRTEDTTPEALAARVETLKSSFEEVSYDVLSVAKPEHQISYENIQARLRQVLIMLFSNVENKLAIANPNLDEGRNSYSTWGGDLHSGQISGNAHKNKSRELEHMRLLYEVGMEGIGPVQALHWVMKNRPSAELQPRGKDGAVTQFDEDQLGRSFEQMNVISYFMLYDRPLGQHERKNSPVEVFEKCRAHPAFAADDIETLHDRIRLSYEKWGHAQFKVHGSPIAATYGQNIDHQTSLRTPNISANQRPEQAELALYCLAEMAKRDGSSVETLTGGYSLDALLQRALLDSDFAARLGNKMWTPGATDGRKMKISSLYKNIQEHGFAPLLGKSRMAEILERAETGHKERSAHVR